LLAALIALILGSILPALAQEASVPSPDVAGPHRHPRPDWAETLTPGQESLLAQLFLERLQAIASLDRGPDRLRQVREIERHLQAKLEEFLTSEQLSGYRAGLPAIFVHEPNATSAAASVPCDNGYAQLEQACTHAVLARDAGAADYQFHKNHNPISINDSLAGASLKQFACEARDIAAQARSNCQLADDAAARAATAIDTARQQQELAEASATHCFLYNGGEINYEANAAAMYAEAAEGYLVAGRDLENACFACCNPDLDAPGSVTALATTASNIKITWQDKSNEDKFVVQKSVNGGAYGDIAVKNAGATQHVDTSGSPEANNRYRVAARLTTCGLQGPWSNIAIVPKAPNNLTYTRSGNYVTLNWNDRSTLETNFEIHRKLGTQGWTVLFPSIPANQETKSGIALQNGVNRFRVLAKTSTGKSWFTNEVSVTK
jgi:hypothetical protein